MDKLNNLNYSGIWLGMEEIAQLWSLCEHITVIELCSCMDSQSNNIFLKLFKLSDSLEGKKQNGNEKKSVKCRAKNDSCIFNTFQCLIVVLIYKPRGFPALPMWEMSTWNYAVNIFQQTVTKMSCVKLIESPEIVMWKKKRPTDKIWITFPVLMENVSANFFHR